MIKWAGIFLPIFLLCPWDTKVIYFLSLPCFVHICTRQPRFSPPSPSHQSSYKPKPPPSLFSQATIFVSIFIFIFEVFHSYFFFSSKHRKGALPIFFPFHKTMQLNIVSTVQHRRSSLEVCPKPMFATTNAHHAFFGMSVIYILNGFFARWIKMKESRTRARKKMNQITIFIDKFIDEFFCR